MKTIIVTRPLAQSTGLVEALRSRGFATVALPVIQIQALEDTRRLDEILARMAQFQWVIFTSVNGVEAVWARLTALGIPGIPSGVKVAAIGPKTAGALQQRDVQVHFVPDEYVAEAILPGLGNIRGKRFLLLRAKIARRALPEAIVAAGGEVEDWAVYRTVPAQPDPEGLAALRQGADFITLTSPSTVHNFVATARQADLDPSDLPGTPVFACIGPITEAAAIEENLAPRIVAEEYTADGLTDAINSLEKRRNKETIDDGIEGN